MKKSRSSLFICLTSILVFSVIVMSGCINNNKDKDSKTPSVQTYTVSVSSSDDLLGMVTGSGTYESGAQATLTATAETGYYFHSWDDGSKDNPRNVKVNENITYIAKFLEGTEIVFNNHRVVVVNGFVEISSDESHLQITANDTQKFGYWYTNTDSKVVATDNSTIILPLSSVTSDIKYTAMNTVVGYGFLTMKDEAAVTELNNKDIRTRNDIILTGTTLYHNIAEVGSGFYTGYTSESEPAITIVNGVTIHTYNIHLKYTHQRVAVFRYYEVLDNNNAIHNVGASRLPDLSGQDQMGLNASGITSTFISEDIKYIVNVSFVPAT